MVNTETVGTVRERERESYILKNKEVALFDSLTHTLGSIKEGKEKIWNKSQSDTKGITLVALVVTIVVLLILAGITLVYVFGDNGIFKLAQDAKDKTDQAKQDEQDYFNNVDNTINKYVNGNGGATNPPTPSEPKVADNLETVISQTENKALVDSYGNKIVVPAGFKIVTPKQDSTVDYSYSGDGKPCVQDGIVIQNEADGNQFVWVPVGTIYDKEKDSTTTITLGRYSNFTVTNGVLPTPAQEASKTNYDTPVAIETYYFEVSDSFTGETAGETTYDAAGDYGNTKAVNLQEWIRTTLDNHGYYLARYEASQNETDNTKAASKSGKTVWVNVTQPKAATAARATYSAENGNNKENYYSDLVNSYAWDTAIVFIEAYDRSDYASKNLGTSTTFRTTGGISDQVCNIHDMSGNAFEWTTESSTNSDSNSGSPCTRRGGYWYSGNRDLGYYTSHRGSVADNSESSYTSYRLILYVK